MRPSSARARRIHSAWITLATLVMVGCSPGPVSPAPQGTQEGALPVPTSTPEAQASRVEAPLSPLPTVDDPTSAEPQPTPTLRVGLQATDPQTVVLASGKPQLVEFFAYW
jgi:hypothetical protein